MSVFTENRHSNFEIQTNQLSLFQTVWMRQKLWNILSYFYFIFQTFYPPCGEKQQQKTKEKNNQFKVCIYPNPFSEIASVEVIPFVNQGPRL